MSIGASRFAGSTSRVSALRAGALQRSLDGYLRFYNLERPHRGYRLKGLTPATKFAGAVAA